MRLREKQIVFRTTYEEYKEIYKSGGKMSKVKWTKEQMQAIEEKNSNILVAAAARKWKNSSSC